jgi:hypothetical protein
VQVPSVEVMANPSAQYVATATLKQNDAVRVVSAENGWVKIMPPAGAHSWINDLFIRPADESVPLRFPALAVVLGESVPVHIGSSLSREPLELFQVRLQRGAVVELLGPKVVVGGATWWQIAPVTGEVRYVPATALDAATAPVPTTVAPTTVPATPTPGTDAPLPDLWLQADRAEQAGDLVAAERLFTQLANELSAANRDYTLRLRCYNRIQLLRERLKPTTTSTIAARPTSPPAVPAAVPTPATRTPGTLTSYPAPGQSAPSQTTPTAASQAGWLRRCGFPIDGVTAYVLENTTGQLRLYCVAQPGVDLEAYVNRPVELTGMSNYRGDIRGQLMSVAQVKWLR